MKNPQAYRVYLILSGASTFFNAVMFTMLTVYYLTVVGMTPLQLMLVGTAMELTAFLFEVPTGIVADTYSRRLSVIIGTFITGAALVLVGCATTFGAVALGLSIWGIGATFLSGAREAWIVDEVGAEHIDRVFMRTAQIRHIAGFLGIFASMGLALVSLQLPIVLGGVMTMLLGGYLILAMPETQWSPQPRAERGAWRDMGATLVAGARIARERPLMRWFLVVAVAFGFYAEVFDRLGEAHFLLSLGSPELGGPETVVWFGLLQAGSRLLGFVATGIGARWLRTDSARATMRALTVLQLLWVAGVIAFGTAVSLAAVLATYWAVGVIAALHGPIYDAWLNRNIDSKTRATALSFLSQADSMGQIASGPVFGQIGTLFSLRTALVGAGLMLTPAFALYWRGGRPQGR